MKSVNVYIKDRIREDVEYDIMVVPNIPDDKLNNAVKSFHCEEFYQSIVAIYDSTKLRTAKEGLVFTGEKMIYKNQGNHWTFPYSKIEKLDYQSDITKGMFGKENFEQWLVITMDGEEYKLEKLDGLLPSQYFSFEHLSSFLQKIIDDFDDFKEENQLRTIAEMPEEFKMAYLKIIVNMTYLDDEEIDEKELAEILLLMTRLELSKESRFELRTYINDISLTNSVSIEDLITTIKENSESSHFQSLMISLAKDMINVYFSTKDTMDRDFKFLTENQGLFNLSDKEIDLAFSAVENDYKMLKKDLDDNAIKKNAQDLAAKAAAAGAPLAAVYISGSVVGMSAAGITSGLATLGMGMGMTGGLVVVGLIGIMTYKGLKHLTGANELDKYKTRELMLHEVIKQTQKTISLIIDDINFIVQKLNDVTLNHVEQSEKIKKLVQMIAKYQNAIKAVDNKANYYQNSANRLQCPKELDISRLEALTAEPTKKPLFDFIVENYEKSSIEVGGEQKNSVVLKDNIDTEILDKMGEVFKSLGYFEMSNIMKGKTSEGIGKIKGMLG